MKVTAAIFRNGDKVLLMRRAADQPLAGEWEYPGGKFEDGEDGPTCLHRELSEELGKHPKYVSQIMNGHRLPRKAEEEFNLALNRLIEKRGG